MKIKLISICILMFFIINLLIIKPVLAGPSSSTYELKEYGFGSGGTLNSSSETYKLQGISGEIETASLSSSTYLVLPGLTYTLEPNTPPAPTFTNPSNFYNKLRLWINQGGNPADTTFAIAVSTDGSFINNVSYVQSDGTLGTNIFFQTYALWQPSGNPVTIIGLTPGATYYAKVAARRGIFQQGRFGAVSSAYTVNPTLSFAIQTSTQTNPPFSVGIGVVNAGQITTSWQSVTATISTNANNGGLVYLYGANSGLKSAAAGNYTITSATADLGSTSEGYGVQGQSVSQTSGGPMELVNPYNGVSANVGVVDTLKRVFADSTQSPVTNGQAVFQLKAKAAASTPAATDYADTITILGTGSF